MNIARPLSFALATTVLTTLPASSAPSAAPPTQVWIDVATHGMAGMPDLGVMGSVANWMMGGAGGPQVYPQSRHIPASMGKVLDIAMYNSLRPGVAADQFVPAGLGVGKSLSLLPPSSESSPDRGTSDRLEDVEITVRQYWGCGATVGAGQPKVMTLNVSKGALKNNGSLAPGLFAPDRDIDADPSYAVWPNQENGKRVSERSSMTGQHRIVGDGVPASLQFELGRNADFMPRISLDNKGELADSIQLQWQPVERARGYFVQAMAVQDERNFVMWSSADVEGAGYELLNYLTGSNIDKWIKQKVLLAPTTQRCAIPQGIFKPTGKGPRDEAVATLNMIAYGPETNLVWPERPADPKQPWKPEWNVRVRTKSTTTAMLGMDLSSMGGASNDEDTAEEPAQEQEGAARKLMRGLLKNL